MFFATLTVIKIEPKAPQLASFGGAFLSFFEAGGRVILKTPIEKITSWRGLGGSERALKTDLNKGMQHLLSFCKHFSCDIQMTVQK